jgi:transcriptional regulator with XRE-family HTH domain
MPQGPAELDYFSLREEIIGANSDVADLLQQSAQTRAAGVILARVRIHAGLSQDEVAKRTGWKTDFISQLEGAFCEKSLEPQTISRYFEACGVKLGLVAYEETKDTHLHIVDAFDLSASPSLQPNSISEALQGLDFEVSASQPKITFKP